MHLLSDICIISNLHRTGFVLLKTWSIFLCWLLVLWNVWLGLQSSRLQYCCWHSLELCLCSNDVAAESLRARYVSVGNIKFFLQLSLKCSKDALLWWHQPTPKSQHMDLRSVWLIYSSNGTFLMDSAIWTSFLCYYPGFIFSWFLKLFSSMKYLWMYWILFYMNLLKFSTCVCCL